MAGFLGSAPPGTKEGDLDRDPQTGRDRCRGLQTGIPVRKEFRSILFSRDRSTTRMRPDPSVSDNTQYPRFRHLTTGPVPIQFRVCQTKRSPGPPHRTQPERPIGAQSESGHPMLFQTPDIIHNPGPCKPASLQPHFFPFPSPLYALQVNSHKKFRST